jgi:hypothetical protein
MIMCYKIIFEKHAMHRHKMHTTTSSLTEHKNYKSLTLSLSNAKFKPLPKSIVHE